MQTGNMTVHYPPEVNDGNGNFSYERLLNYYNTCEGLAKNFIQKLELPITTHRVLILVDFQGVYLAFTRWLSEQNFPLDGGMVASRFAYYLLGSVTRGVESKVIKEFDNGVVFNDLVRMVFRKDIDRIQPMRHVVDIKTSIELFYAPVPLGAIEGQLRRRAREGSVEARRQWDDIRNGILKPHGDVRDYTHYDHFIQCMKENATVSRFEEGFFNFHVGPLGLKSFDEKEVDTRLVIRAVDACVDYEADSICIISSDQDFVPLHERCEKSGVRSYQADVSKFAAPERVGRKIRDLGDRFIPVRIDPEWPMRAVCEACGHDPFNGVPVDKRISEGISSREFSALCQLHNDMNNDYHLEATVTADGEASVKVIDRRSSSEGL